jgi:four helix bundle protein
MVEYKFERLEVWQLSLTYIDICYDLTNRLPKREEFNLQSQFIRAATSIALNIAEGSTSQSNAEQARFLSLALRSLVETVACRRLSERRGYINHLNQEQAEQLGLKLFAKLQDMRRSLTSKVNQQSAVAGR